MPLRDEDVWPSDQLERPSSLISREAKENLTQRLMQIAKIGNDPLPVGATMTARWVLGVAYGVMTSFHYPHPGPRSQFLPVLETMKWWVGRLPDAVLPDRHVMAQLDASAVRTFVELVLYRGHDRGEHAVMHFHPALTLEQAAGLLRANLGWSRSVGA